MQQWLVRFWEQRADAILLNALQVALIVALLVVARWIGGRIIQLAVRALTRKIELSDRRQAQIRTISGLLNSVLSYVLLFVGILSILGALGVNLGPILATAGVTGLAISLGAQQIVRDVINGFFILVEDQFTVGEEVTIDGIHGVVETMGMRITRLRDDEGRLITLSNSSISRVINHSRGQATLQLEVGIAAEYGLAQARLWLADACATFSHPSLHSPLELHGPATLDPTRYLFRIRGKVPPPQMEAVGDALRAYLLERAQADGVPLR